MSVLRWIAAQLGKAEQLDNPSLSDYDIELHRKGDETEEYMLWYLSTRRRIKAAKELRKLYEQAVREDAEQKEDET